MWKAVALAGGVGLALFGLSRPLDAASVLLTIAGSAVLLAAARSILPDGTLTARAGLPAAIATKFLVNFSFFGAEAFLPLALRELRGFSLTGAGVVLTCAALSWAAGAFLHSRLALRIAPRLLSGGGSTAVLLGIAGVFLLVTSDAPGSLALVSWALAGFGIGVVYNTATAEAMNDTPVGREGDTSTALGAADALGFALAAGVGGAILAASGRAGVPAGTSIAWIFAAMLGVGALLFASGGRLTAPGPVSESTVTGPP